MTGENAPRDGAHLSVADGELATELAEVMWAFLRRLRAETTRSELPLAQQAVLARLHATPAMTSSDLARAELVSPQAMNSTVAAALTAGLVRAERDEADGRRMVLHLTADGEVALREAREGRQTWLVGRIEVLSAEQRAGLDVTLATLRALLDDGHQTRVGTR